VIKVNIRQNFGILILNDVLISKTQIVLLPEQTTACTIERYLVLRIPAA